MCFMVTISCIVSLVIFYVNSFATKAFISITSTVFQIIVLYFFINVIYNILFQMPQPTYWENNYYLNSLSIFSTFHFPAISIHILFFCNTCPSSISGRMIDFITSSGASACSRSLITFLRVSLIHSEA